MKKIVSLPIVLAFCALLIILTSCEKDLDGCGNGMYYTQNCGCIPNNQVCSGGGGYNPTTPGDGTGYPFAQGYVYARGGKVQFKGYDTEDNQKLYTLSVQAFNGYSWAPTSLWIKGHSTANQLQVVVNNIVNGNTWYQLTYEWGNLNLRNETGQTLVYPSAMIYQGTVNATFVQ